MRLARQLHLYFGVFFAPSFIFFAFTGLLQTYSLHEGKNAQPWITALEQVHTHQRMPGPLGAPAVVPTSANPAQPAPSSLTTAPAPTAAPSTTAQKSPSAGTSLQSPSPTAAQAPATTPAQTPPPRRKRSMPMRIFMGFMAVGLIGSSLVGIWMGFQLRQPSLIWTLLLAGTIIPIAALYIGTRP